MFSLDRPGLDRPGRERSGLGRSTLDRSTPDVDVVWSPSDLVVAARCEHALLSRLDEVLGRSPRAVADIDPMLERAAHLGDAHERRVLDALAAEVARAGEEVVRVDPPRITREALVEAHATTLAALEAGAAVVHQASFFDGEMHGRADFLVRAGAVPLVAADGARLLDPITRRPDTAGGVPPYAVVDAKLARRAKVEALVQLAAYADQLVAAGVPVVDAARLVLGTDEWTEHRLVDLLPVLAERRGRLRALVEAHRAQDGPVVWGDPRWTACGRCDRCAVAVREHRDVLMVAGVRVAQRALLAEHGITTIDALAVATEPPPRMRAATFEKIRRQAALQVGGPVQQHVAHEGAVEYTVTEGDERVRRRLTWQVVDDAAVRRLPPPSPGDVFFDFEGDPLWTDGARWGLDYLFGYVERPVGGADPAFTAYWAHTADEERAALVAFMDDLAARRREHPDLHVYHYASYERTHLLSIAARHGVYEQEVDDLLRDGVLVDLYAVVRAALRVSSDSYSIKKLEPLYMGDRLRGGDVKDAAASVVAYAEYCDLRDRGDAEAADRLLAGIADYNEYDCVSTHALLEWLRAAVGLAPGDAGPAGTAADDAGPGASSDTGGAGPDGTGPAGETGTGDAGTGDAGTDDAGQGAAPGPRDVAHALADRIRRVTGEPPHRDPAEQALAMLGAAVGYYEREAKPFWHEHFSRLTDSPDEWLGRRHSLVVERARVLTDWEVEPGKRTPSRRIELRGRLEDGSELRAGSSPTVLYDAPLPPHAKTAEHATRGWTGSATVLAVERAGDLDVLVVREGCPRGTEPWGQLPMGLAPSAGPQTTPQEKSVLDVAQAALAQHEADGTLPRTPAVEVLRRSGHGVGEPGRPALPPVGSGGDRYVDAITAAVRQADGGYVGVQGPPGTGKTYVASHVIARLVADGWRIGVVAQSHAVVENLLRGVVGRAGVPLDRVAKKSRSGERTTGPGQPGPAGVPLVDGKALAAFAAAGPCVVGGTAWDFANAANFPDACLDLLVVDEAGQFSLANTVAVGRSARRLLLLGDPQQLPQVSQGQHPEPVDASALAHLIGEHGVLPAEHGYFLDTTWRMHSALARHVSRLSYEDRLTSEPFTDDRHLDGVPPGVSCVQVEHAGNQVASREEAEEVVRLAQGVVGRAWTTSGGDGPTTRPLAPADVIVVAAYNAQVWAVRHALERAGLGGDDGVRVGTVDTFQGQEAPVAILTTAASSAADAPRGAGFLLSRNRVNVAVSRGQWCAVVVRSTRLTEHLPGTPHELEELGGFVGLCAMGTVSGSSA
ncbi:uncharacterized protein CLV28_2956 [Sediminihabitans luteus]|uniref:AAA+ ATPase domain-containing protein n=1 Tax=Sediminihabitans luteus TaxID=1138585 RepID=A0A2M9CC06_9CELL|nr:TM0106 family RecB-like putative nuclease [Sediminihabitans luteus]PJJ68540.1 uncharacterized protein CLV28_2956 [Sediminihabitans luteus]GII99875.1 hypothetical protein Slu03_22530 [Sediminihabitans luteus]